MSSTDTPTDPAPTNDEGSNIDQAPVPTTITDVSANGHDETAAVEACDKVGANNYYSLLLIRDAKWC